jgi:hypothetical protein
MRGLAALIMLQGHVFHSFTDQSLREQSAYVLSQFFGGITPAVFLFLTGLTLAFLMDSRTRQSMPPRQRIAAALRRAGYLALLAFAFRFQLWLFSAGQSPWEHLFKVDILNCMALAILVLSPLAATGTLERVRWAGGAGIAVALLAPLVSAADSSWLHPFVARYFIPNADFFAFFPWAAFVAFGVSAGSILRLTKADQVHRLMQWSTLIGLGLIGAAQYMSNLPYSLYGQSEFWLNSPGLVFIKTGVLLLLTSVAFLWTRYLAPTGWSPLRQLGATSLLVYWVHTELVYGWWLGSYKESSPVAAVVILAALIIVLMLVLSVARTGWRGQPSLYERLRRWLGGGLEPLPQPAAGD